MISMLPFAVIIFAYVLWKPLPLFFIPGILLLHSEVRCAGLPSTLILAVASSLSYWVASFWMLKYVHVPLTHIYHTTFALTIAGMIVLRFGSRKQCGLAVKPEDYVVGFVLAVVALVRFSPMFEAIVPPGADMSMHAYITALIADVDGIPGSYQPFLNLDTFDTFPVGFHTIGALISLLGNEAVYRAIFIATCVTFTLLTCTLFLLIRHYRNWQTSLITALWFSFLINEPLAFVGWGGNPTVLALVFVVFFVVSFLKIKSYFSIYVFLASLFLSAVLLSHTVIFVQAVYVLGASFLVLGLMKRFEKFFLMPGLAIVLLFLSIAAPYLMSMNEGIATPATLVWIENWVRNTDHAWQGSIGNFVWSIPLYVGRRIFVNLQFGIITVLLSLGGMFVLYQKDRPTLFFYSTFVAACILLILNARYWALPLSFAIYPERVASMAIVPLSVFFSYGLSGLLAWISHLPGFQQHMRIRRAAAVVLTILFVVCCYRYNERNYVNLFNHSPVTEDDMAAFEWLELNSAPSALIASNYGDAGLWIPAVVQRRVTNPHVNVAYLDKLKQDDQKPDLFFVGSRCCYSDSCQQKSTTFLADPSFVPVFRSGEAYVFQKK